MNPVVHFEIPYDDQTRVAGGTVLGEPGVGLYVSFLDTEKNRISMLQASPRR